MKTFDAFLESKKLETLANLIVKHKFPIEQFADWYMVEGAQLDDDHLRVFVESFWGDTWKGAAAGGALGAGVGAVGGGAGAVGGGALGAAAGGLWGAGKHLWNRWKGNDWNVTRKQALKVLSRLEQQAHGQNWDNLQTYRQFYQLVNGLTQLLQNAPTQPQQQTQQPQSQQQPAAQPQQQPNWDQPLP